MLRPTSVYLMLCFVSLVIVGVGIKFGFLYALTIVAAFLYSTPFILVISRKDIPNRWLIHLTCSTIVVIGGIYLAILLFGRQDTVLGLFALIAAFPYWAWTTSAITKVLEKNREN